MRVEGADARRGPVAVEGLHQRVAQVLHAVLVPADALLPTRDGAAGQEPQLHPEEAATEHRRQPRSQGKRGPLPLFALTLFSFVVCESNGCRLCFFS